MKCYIISDIISDFSDGMNTGFESEHTRSSAEDGLIHDNGSVGPTLNITENIKSLLPSGTNSGHTLVLCRTLTEKSFCLN